MIDSKQIRNLIKFGTGLSSNSILEKYLGENKDYYYDYPYDYSDLIRCITIVNIFDIDINIMKDASDIWSNIVDNWADLLEMINLDQKNEVNELLKSLRTE